MIIVNFVLILILIGVCIGLAFESDSKAPITLMLVWLIFWAMISILFYIRIKFNEKQ